MHGSVRKLDSPPIRDRVLHNLERYEELGGRSVRRMVTVTLRDCSELWDSQTDLIHLESVFEQPLRFQVTNRLHRHDQPRRLRAPTHQHHREALSELEECWSALSERGVYRSLLVALSSVCLLCEVLVMGLSDYDQLALVPRTRRA